jgi:hypothetical protein
LRLLTFLLRDLSNPTAIMLKGGLFLVLGLLCALLLVLEQPTARFALLLALTIWGLCRFYYFAFYVIEHYVDPRYKFRGLLSFASYLSGGRDTGRDLPG